MEKLTFILRPALKKEGMLRRVLLIYTVTFASAVAGISVFKTPSPIAVTKFEGCTHDKDQSMSTPPPQKKKKKKKKN